MNQSSTKDSTSQNTSVRPAAFRSRSFTKGTPPVGGIDLHQSSGAQLGYIESMRIALAQLLVLLAVIALIEGGPVAVAGLAEQASGIGAKIDVASDVLTPSASGVGQMTTYVVAMGEDNQHDDCGCEWRLDCLHAAGSGCCAASISATGECNVLDCASVAARLIAGQAILATGIDPEARLQPPQLFA